LGQAVLRVLRAAGYSASMKNVLTSEGQRRADIEVLNIGRRALCSSGIYCSMSLSAMISSVQDATVVAAMGASSGPARDWIGGHVLTEALILS